MTEQEPLPRLPEQRTIQVPMTRLYLEDLEDLEDLEELIRLFRTASDIAAVHHDFEVARYKLQSEKDLTRIPLKQTDTMSLSSIDPTVTLKVEQGRGQLEIFNAADARSLGIAKLV